jgi:hypothetical protein
MYLHGLKKSGALTMQPSPSTSRAPAEVRHGWLCVSYPCSHQVLPVVANRFVDVVITLAIRQAQTTAKLDQAWMPPR